jgi:hypothetical protein
VEDGFVADGEFVVSGGDGAVAFESVDSAFDGVPGSVVVRAEPGRAAAEAAAVLAVVLLVCWFGDGAGDAASAQVGAVGLGAVGLVGPDLVGSCAVTACADARDVDAVQDGPELGRVTAGDLTYFTITTRPSHRSSRQTPRHLVSRRDR